MNEEVTKGLFLIEEGDLNKAIILSFVYGRGDNGAREDEIENMVTFIKELMRQGWPHVDEFKV